MAHTPNSEISRRSLLRVTGVLGLGALGLTACASPSSSKDGGTGDGSLTLGFNRTFPSLDNKLNQFDAQVTVQRAVHQALTSIGQDLKLQQVLAESFTQTGPKEWTVKLRDGIVYSDGSKVAVNDVKAAIAFYQAVNGSFVAQQFPEWPTVQEVDERTFKLVTNSPQFYLDRLMSNIMLMPADKNQAKEIDTAVGTGPFVIASADSGAGTFELGPNTKYWGTKPALSKVKLRFIKEDSVRIAALQRGEVDVIDSIPPDAAKQLESIDGVSLVRSTGTRLVQLFYNFRKPAGTPLADPKVREALSYAIDGNTLIKNVLLNSVAGVKGVVPQTLVGAADVGSYQYDPAKAKGMLASAGASDLSITMIWEAGEFFSDSQVIEAIAGMLKDVGVKTTLKQFQPGGDILNWRQGKSGDWDVLANGYGNQTGLAITSLQGMFAGTPEREQTRDTYQGYVQPPIVKLLNDAGGEADEAKRTALLTQAQQAIWATWPCMWAFVQNNALAHRKRVGNLTLLPTNSYDLASVKVTG